jgi:hypothetical protein
MSRAAPLPANSHEESSRTVEPVGLRSGADDDDGVEQNLHETDEGRGRLLDRFSASGPARWRLDADQSVRAANVSQASMLPVRMPVSNQRWRWAEVP